MAEDIQGDETRATFSRLLEVLVKEERYLVRLIELARDEREALLQSNYEAIDEVANQMISVAAELDSFEGERALLLQELDAPAGATLKDLEPLAVSAGADGLAEARERMVARADELQATQEQNARLILAATQLRERWFNLLMGMNPATYSDKGREERPGQRFVSRSA
ncbi:MAG: flagellar protein FlgN [Dehalococcoidia bacterium]|nr:flagellar protein FlgN [Dehalococcoidia bacterium]MCA9843533.1 flagellar protein FlgN [Dehalococcoidia bacterium]MCA9852684.1 flagellar protein FlgN [Dehalococcoidia bacterium]